MIISIVIAFLFSMIGICYIDTGISRSTGKSLGCGGYILIFTFLFVAFSWLIYLILGIF